MWLRRDIQQCQFKDYDLTYAFFCKFPSWGCLAELYSCANCIAKSNILPTSFFLPNCTFPKFIHASFLSHFKNLSVNVFSLNTKKYSLFVFTVFRGLVLSTFCVVFLLKFYRTIQEIMSIVNQYLEADLSKYKFLTENRVLLQIFDTTDTLFDHDFDMHKSFHQIVSNDEHFYFSPFSFFYIFFTLFSPPFTFTDFESPLVLFSWWRNKISWELL